MIQKIVKITRQGGATIEVCARQVFGKDILSTLATNINSFIRFVIFVLLWKGFAKAGVDLGGLSEENLLTYTLLSFVTRKQMDIVTPATAALWEGSVVARYARPMSIYVSYIAETIGRWWFAYWIFVSLPLFLLALLWGINPWPASALHGVLFLVSLLLSTTIGFGFDILFAAIAIRMKNNMWIATQIRWAISSLLSGSLIPFALFPKAIAKAFSLLPFGSIANAPLSIYIGAQNAGGLLFVQFFWAVTIWLIAHFLYKKSEERMVSYGG